MCGVPHVPHAKERSTFLVVGGRRVVMKKNNKLKKRIYVIVSHSLGEVDTLLPFVYNVHENDDIQFKIVFTVRKIYEKYLNNKFYKYSLNKENIKVQFIPTFNKFDYPRLINENYFLTMLRGLFIYPLFHFYYFINSLGIMFYDIYIHETTRQKNATYIMYFFSKLFKKKILVYHHGHSLNQVGKFPKTFKVNQNVVFLLFSKLNISWLESIGYKKYIIIGMIKFSSRWLNHVKNYIDKKKKKQNYIVIFSRSYKNSAFIDYETYEFLLLSSYKIINKLLPNYKIFIKPHPREIESDILYLINRFNLKNIEINTEHSAVLAKDAFLTISLWTSAILDSLSMGVPSIEYFKETKKFLVAEPEGSPYRKYGISSANNELDLELNIKNIINNSYKNPDIVESFKKEINFDFFKFLDT